MTLHTSSESEPFDGSAYLTLFAEGEQTAKAKLEVVTLDPNAPAGGAPFMPGGTVVCKFRAIAIGTLTKAAISVVRSLYPVPSLLWPKLPLAPHFPRVAPCL